MDVGDDEQREIGEHRAEADHEGEDRGEVADRRTVLEDRAKSASPPVGRGPSRQVSGLADPDDGDPECEYQQAGDRGVGPARDASAASGKERDREQERDLTQQLDPIGQPGQEAPVSASGDIRQKGDLGVRGDVEEDREQDDADGQADDVPLAGGEQEARRGERDRHGDEWPAAAERLRVRSDSAPMAGWITTPSMLRVDASRPVRRSPAPAALRSCGRTKLLKAKNAPAPIDPAE